MQKPKIKFGYILCFMVKPADTEALQKKEENVFGQAESVWLTVLAKR